MTAGTTGVIVGGRQLRVSPAAAVHAEISAWAAGRTDLEGVRPIERVAHRPASFVRIHPFTDGKGRTGRLLVNWELIRLDYPPSLSGSSDGTRICAVSSEPIAVITQDWLSCSAGPSASR